jgi:Pilus assembly protein, PilO
VTAKLAQNKVTVAAAAAVLLLSVLLYMVVVSPKRSRSAKLEDEIAATQVELAQARLAEARVKEPQVLPIGDLKRLTKAMPSETDMPGLVLELARVAQESGISFDSITPAEPIAGAGFQKIPVSLVFQGNFYELSDFLFRLRNLVEVRENKLRVDGRLFSVDGIDFAQGTEEFPQIQATVNANAFAYSGTPAAAPPAPPPPAESTTPSAAGAS